MSDQTQSNNQQAIVYALVAIAVLLLVIVGFMIYQKATVIPAPTGAVSSSSAPATTGSSSSGNIMGSSSVAPAEFDPKTATKLPSGMTPEQAMTAYSKAVTAAKWSDAYALLPLAQKQQYQSADAMGQQLAQYNISGFDVGKATTNGNDVVIVAQENTPAMNITYTWTFTKDGGTWYVKQRTMGGTLNK
jgi:hypothetical protein